MRLSHSGNSLGRLGVVVEDVEEEPVPPAEAGLLPPEDVVEPPAEAEPEAGLVPPEDDVEPDPPEGGVVPEAGLVVLPEGGVVPLFLFLLLLLAADATSVTTLISPITFRVASRALPALLF